MISRIRLETGFFDALRALLPFPKPKQRLAGELEAFFNAKHVLLLASGRAAIYYLLKALPQKNVFLPAYTCAVVKEAVLLAGKIPVEIDIDLETFSFNAKALAKSIKPGSIVLATHQFGIPCGIIAIKELCKKNNCVLIEDNAAALGTRANGKLTGTFGSASILSFDYTKTLTCARGGAIVFNDAELFEEVKKILPKSGKEGFFSGLKRFFYVSFYNFFASPIIYSNFTLPLLTKNSLFADKGQISNVLYPEYLPELSDFQAKLGLLQFSRIEKTIEKRKALAQFFQKALAGTPNLAIPRADVIQDSILIRFPIIVPMKNKLVFYYSCRAKAIDLGFSFSYSLAEGKNFPNSMLAASRVLDLPFYSWLSKKEAMKIVEAAKEVAEKASVLELIALATNNPKPQRFSLLLEEKSNSETIGIAGIIKRSIFPFFFLAVKPEFQGKGIGNILTKKFLASFKGDFVFLSVSNEIAEHIYLKHGFRVIGKKGKSIFMVFEKNKTLGSRIAIFLVSLSLEK